MANIYKRTSTAWVQVKAVWKRDASAWRAIKAVFGKVGTVWQPVFNSTIPFTFTSSITSTSTSGILLSSYVNPASGDNFTITINSGVVLRGKTGTTGTTGAKGTSLHTAGYPGGVGGGGYPALNLTGFAGKTIIFKNYGSIIGGTGGTGGRGGAGYNGYICHYNGGPTSGGPGGAGAAGGVYLTFTGSIGITWSVAGTRASGATGATGATGTSGYVSSGSCFTAGQQVLMADGTLKNIEDIKVGEKVRGAYGYENTVKYLDRPILGNRKLFKVNGLTTTDEHGMLNGNKDGFLYISLETGFAEYGTTQKVLDENGNELDYLFEGLSNTKREQLELGSLVTGPSGVSSVETLDSFEDSPDTQLYHLITDGDMTYSISDIFVSSMANDKIFDYTNGKAL